MLQKNALEWSQIENDLKKLCLKNVGVIHSEIEKCEAWSRFVQTKYLFNFFVFLHFTSESFAVGNFLVGHFQGSFYHDTTIPQSPRVPIFSDSCQQFSYHSCQQLHTLLLMVSVADNSSQKFQNGMIQLVFDLLSLQRSLKLLYGLDFAQKTFS